MSETMVDSLRIYERLKATRSKDALIREIAGAFGELVDSKLATKRDIAELRAVLEARIEVEGLEVKHDLIRWVAGMLLAEGGADCGPCETHAAIRPPQRRQFDVPPTSSASPYGSWVRSSGTGISAESAKLAASSAPVRSTPTPPILAVGDGRCCDNCHTPPPFARRWS